MVGKSIDFYAFIGADGLSVEFQASTDWNSKTNNYSYAYDSTLPMRKGTDEISESDIGVFDHYGKFRWTANQLRSGKTVQLATEYWNIAPSTGSMQTGQSGSPTDMMTTTSLFNTTDNWAISYGFYDSGSGIGNDLTNHDQSYVYLTEDMSGWMGNLVKKNAVVGTLPFNAFVLPGAHDAGTYDQQYVQQLVNNSVFQDMLKKSIKGFVEGTLIGISAGEIERLVIDFACTQVNDVTGMLNMGIRYFDFRPGYGYDGFGLQSIYHQHSFIPGAQLADFMDGIFRWLLKNTSEIVVVSLNFQGLKSDDMKPPVAALTSIVTTSQNNNKASAIVLGDVTDLATAYNDLIKAGKRLIFLNQIDDDAVAGSANNTVKYDSYSPDLYQTTNVSNVITALNKMSKSGQKAAASNYTVLQLQGTSQTTVSGDAQVVLDWSSSGSPLMSTKGMFDNQTYQWLMDNVRPNLGQAQPIVFLNDFADNALAKHAWWIMNATLPAKS